MRVVPILMMLLQWQLYLLPRQELVVWSGLSGDCACTVEHVLSSIRVASGHNSMHI